jgi:hypothetical protein
MELSTKTRVTRKQRLKSHSTKIMGSILAVADSGISLDLVGEVSCISSGDLPLTCNILQRRRLGLCISKKISSE